MFQKLRTDLKKRLSQIKLLLVNADGFLGENANDDYKIGALKKIGINTLIFSTKTPDALHPIISRLGIELLHDGVSQKSVLYSKLKIKHGISDDEVAFICRDISDIPIIEKAGFPVAIADAPIEVKAKSYYVSYGVAEDAVKEVAELILKANGTMIK